MVSLTNGGLPTRLGFHELNIEERRPEPPPERVGLTGLGRPSWAFPGPVSAHLVTRFVFCILDHGPLQLWALDVVISATKLRGLYA
jgi:hypothetical protein